MALTAMPNQAVRIRLRLRLFICEMRRLLPQVRSLS